MALLCEERLKGVDERLVKVVRLAANYLNFDLLVVEGLRTQARQAELVKIGASRTMNSKHLVGRAVDLAPSIKGDVRWDWPLFHVIFDAMRKAAFDLKVEHAITWGGVWDRRIGRYEDSEKEVALYMARFRRKTGRRPFVDGPHYEIE